MGGIATCLWLDGRAEEAAAFYVAAFRRAGRAAEAGPPLRQGAEGPGPEGAVLVATVTLDGHEVVLLNGGPAFPFSPAVSLTVTCEEQAAVDRFWEALSEGGETGRCGWLTDRFGLSWQVVPRVLPELLRHPDRARADRVMRAMMGMTRLDIAALEAA
ncbi:VOC family protein [Roseomonas nepalensis]|uniref:VOC family protein n=1 Tax=Muricoccus nepalensis TaxID=1854500 RepID=A0A502FDE8_9PROT|nr:VOC family protein [Roseomonas nepalensis]TPG47303.1 VOC family protein [Roseomonas nepalensis]